MTAGLGSTWKLDGSGNWVDCDLWSNMLNGSCWNPWNPQLAGPNSVTPNAPSNPVTDVALGAGSFSLSDYVNSVVEDPSGIIWMGALVVVGVIVVKEIL